MELFPADNGALCLCFKSSTQEHLDLPPVERCLFWSA